MMGKTSFYIYNIFKDFFGFFISIFNGIRTLLRKPFTLVVIYSISSILLIIISLKGFFSSKGINALTLIIMGFVLLSVTILSHIECGYYEDLWKKYKERKLSKAEEDFISTKE